MSRMDHAGRPSRARLARNPLVETLEVRELMSASTLSDIVMVSARTADSKSVTIDYRIDNAAVTQPITIQVERSADSQPHDSDIVVANLSIAPTGQLDDRGQPAAAVGEHQITLALPGGLPPTPALPYVVVRANAGNTIAESNTSNDTAAFHKYSVAVIAHGGLQPKSWRAGGPPWERHLADTLRQQGFDQVIAYNWVANSGVAGAAAKQAPKLATIVANDINGLSTSDPVDVQFIGHSEGAVVNSQTVLTLNQNGWPKVAQQGYLKMTMLDPHAANNGVKGQQYSVSHGLFGWIAQNYINDYQSRAHDPPVVVPANVDSAEVYYQHTPISHAGGSNDGIYNLWGQVPIHGQAAYYNLTATGISHAGKFGVQDWYTLNVAPALGNGAPAITSQALSVNQQGDPISALRRPRLDPTSGPKKLNLSGTAAPDTVVRVYVGRAGHNAFNGDLRKVGQTTSDAQGNWQLTTTAIAHGHYRGVVQAAQEVTSIRRRSPMKPIAWLPSMTL